MKSRNPLFKGLYLMTFALLLLSSCKSNPAEEHESTAHHELIAAIGQYVTCPADSVEMMIASSDSIIQLIDTYSLELLDLTDQEVNRNLESLYSQEIPTIIKLYASYDVVTNFPTSEANAVFAWHEIANTLIAEYCKKEQADATDVAALFNVIDDILDSYAAGTQRDMNTSAWRWVMLSDYRLISAYKALYNSCNDPSLLQSIQDSYVDLLEMYRNKCEQIEGYWSDLPRELASMQMNMMEERQAFIESLQAQYKQGTLTPQAVKAELDKRSNERD